MTVPHGAEFLTEATAFGKVPDHRFGEKRLGTDVAGPLKLLVAPGHVFDQILHPEQRIATVSHRGVVPDSSLRIGGIVRAWFKNAKTVPLGRSDPRIAPKE